jgi:hypothetical protein
MRTHLQPYWHLILVILVLFFVSLACSVPWLETSEPESEDAIHTKVAQTMAAMEGEEEVQEITQAVETVLPSPTFTPEPTDTPTPPDIAYQGICFSFDESWIGSVSVEQVEGMLDPQSPWNSPDHIRFLFGDYPLTDTFHEPQIRVFSVKAFRSVNDNVGDRLDELRATIDNQPADPEVYVSHFFNAMQYFAAQEAYVDFQNGSGVRYISQYGQAAVPIGYPEMFYTFQGLTDDNAHYISVVMPVSHPFLPDTSTVTLDQAFYDNWETYIDNTTTLLDGQPPESFVPSLLELDALVATLYLDENCALGGAP